MDDVDLRFDEDALRAIAQKAYECNTGARGLPSVLSELLQDAMFDLPSYKGRQLIITAEMVSGESEIVASAKAA